MEQILAHLVGDYILQTDKMATLKTKTILWAFIHAAVYTLPFLLLTHSVAALLVICLTHTVIDRYRLAKYVVAAKNAATDWGGRAQFATATGYAETTPAWMAVWLFIIADNTMHVCINYAALRWL